MLALAGTLWRRKFALAACALVALLLGAYYAFFVAVPTYRSTTSLALELRNEPVVDIEALVSGASTDDAALNTEIEVIRSRGLIRQLVQELNLLADPEFNSSLRPAPAFSLRKVVAAAIDQLPFDLPALPEPRGAGIEPLVETEEEPAVSAPPGMNATIGAVRRAVAANVQRNTYVFDISVTTQSPRKSMVMANTLAELYIENQIDQKFSATESAVTWLSTRVVELEEELRNRESELKALRTQVDLVSLEGLEALNRQLIVARERAEAVASEISEAEARLSQIAALRAEQDYLGLDSIFDDNTLSALVRDGSDTSAIEARLDLLTDQLDNSLTRQRQRLETLMPSVERLEGQVEAQSDEVSQLQQIEREIQTTRTLYETFLTRLKEATVQRGTAQADSRVLSEAIMGNYVSPNKSRILMLSLILGLLVGAAIVLARQLGNKGYRSAEELETSTGRSVLGQIPLMPIKRRNQLITYFNDKPTSAAAEAIRNLRTSILLSSPDKPSQIIMSTSSLPGEGKTTQAIALAHNLAGLDKKVILIEGDVRRRTLNQYFRKDVNTAEGIGSALQTDASMEEIAKFIIRDPRLDVDVILGEKIAQNAADVFSSAKFKRFLGTLQAHYDYVVIDTPPVLIVPDARVIGQYADTVVFNVAWDRTSRVQVREALRQLSTVNISVTGLVLSQISPAGMKRYGYGGKYGSYAGYGSSYYES